MICPFCGVQIPDNTKFCTNCGGAIVHSEEPKSYSVIPDHDVSEPAPETPAPQAAEAVAGAAAGAAGAAGAAVGAAAEAAEAAPAADGIPYAQPADATVPYAQPADPTIPYAQPAADPTIPYAQPADPSYVPPSKAADPTIPYAQPADQGNGAAQPNQGYTYGQGSVKDTGSYDASQQPTQTYGYDQPQGGGYNQPQGGAAPYTAPQQTPGRGLSIASLICGIASIVLCAFLPIVVGIVGLVLGIIGRKKSKSGMALGGIITSIVGIILGLIITITVGAYVINYINNYDYDEEVTIEEFDDEFNNLEDSTDDLTGGGNNGFNSTTSGNNNGGSGTGLGTGSGTSTAPVSSGTYPAECTDANGNLTAYALLELNGSDLVGLMNELGYTWDEFSGYWTSPDGSSALQLSSDGDYFFEDEEMPSLPAGSVGTSMVYDLEDMNYRNAVDAFDNLVNVTVVDSFSNEDDDIVLGRVKNSAGVEYIVIAVSEGNDTDLLFFNDQSLEGGILDYMMDGDFGSSVSAVWDYFNE